MIVVTLSILPIIYRPRFLKSHGLFNDLLQKASLFSPEAGMLKRDWFMLDTANPCEAIVVYLEQQRVVV